MDFEVAYPEVVPGITDWANSISHNDYGVNVTAHGLRRLLRIAADAQSSLMQMMCEGQELSDDDMKLLNDVTAVWCEGDLVMSGLFISKEDGKPVVHPNPEISNSGLTSRSNAAVAGEKLSCMLCGGDHHSHWPSCVTT